MSFSAKAAKEKERPDTIPQVRKKQILKIYFTLISNQNFTTFLKQHSSLVNYLVFMWFGSRRMMMSDFLGMCLWRTFTTMFMMGNTRRVFLELPLLIFWSLCSWLAFAVFPTTDIEIANMRKMATRKILFKLRLTIEHPQSLKSVRQRIYHVPMLNALIFVTWLKFA